MTKGITHESRPNIIKQKLNCIYILNKQELIIINYTLRDSAL
jgi:hypothetical protein